MINVHELTHAMGSKLLYEGISCQIQASDKIGLIGPNGAGKTTFLHMLGGSIQPDRGRITKPKDCTIRLLSQDLLSTSTAASIKEVTMEVLPAFAIQQKIDKLLRQIEQGSNDQLLQVLSDLQEQFAQTGGYAMEAEAEKMLEGIGFATADLDRSLSSFSGGWQMRVMLARLLLERPNLLLLDEPTNHLDIESIQWIEQYLQSYPNAYMVISHDRRFLDQVSEKTFAIQGGGIQCFPGNYSFFEEKKALQDEVQQQAYQNQQRQIQKAELFIERFRAKASKATQAQSKMKALGRMERIAPLKQAKANISIRFPSPVRPGREVISLAGIDKCYGDQLIFLGAEGLLERGDKVALVGANGRGKSTLLEIMAKRLPIDSGRVTYGHQASIAFYAQHQLEVLKLDHSIIEELRLAAPHWSEKGLRALLGSFLFAKDDVYKPIKVLSGGEKARVALAKVLTMEANVLLLDEPTNHLDMASIEVLIQALQQYPGSYVTVSHNRYFIEQVASKVWFIDNCVLRCYPGDYQGYVYWRSKEKSRATKKGS